VRFGIHGSGFDVYGLWFGFEVWVKGFRVEELRFRVEGSPYRV